MAPQVRRPIHNILFKRSGHDENLNMRRASLADPVDALDGLSQDVDGPDWRAKDHSVGGCEVSAMSARHGELEWKNVVSDHL
jgi:hypothetical protein